MGRRGDGEIVDAEVILENCPVLGGRLLGWGLRFAEADVEASLGYPVSVPEYVFHIEGLGFKSYHAVRKRDVSLILGTAMVVAFAGVVTSALQGVVESLLDPRVEL